MRGKLLFVTGLAVGYVVGARAGRPAYDALTARIEDVASSPRVRDAAAHAKAGLEEKAPAVTDALQQAAQTAAGTVAAVQEAPAEADDDHGSKDASASATAAPTPPADAEAAPGPAASDSARPTASKPTGSRRVRSSGGAPAEVGG